MTLLLIALLLKIETPRQEVNDKQEGLRIMKI